MSLNLDKSDAHRLSCLTDIRIVSSGHLEISLPLVIGPLPDTHIIVVYRHAVNSVFTAVLDCKLCAFDLACNVSKLAACFISVELAKLYLLISGQNYSSGCIISGCYIIAAINIGDYAIINGIT